MRQRVFCVNDQKFFEPSSYDAFLAGFADGTSYFWMDVAQPDTSS
jgi:hypothetical protein